MDTSYRIGQLQDAAASALGRRMFASLRDGFGCVLELLVSFAEACHDNSLTLFLVLSWNEIFITTYDTSGVPSTDE